MENNYRKYEKKVTMTVGLIYYIVLLYVYKAFDFAGNIMYSMTSMNVALSNKPRCIHYILKKHILENFDSMYVTLLGTSPELNTIS